MLNTCQRIWNTQADISIVQKLKDNYETLENKFEFITCLTKLNTKLN